MHFMKKKSKVYYLISKKKYSISINIQNLIHHFKGPTKNIDFNDFIDFETLLII